MTLRDLIDGTILIQGLVEVKCLNEDTECVFDGDGEDLYELYDYLDREVSYIYTNVFPIYRPFSSNPIYISKLIIEIEEEE